jgi:hypothetical protein
MIVGDLSLHGCLIVSFLKDKLLIQLAEFVELDSMLFMNSFLKILEILITVSKIHQNYKYIFR